MEEKTYIVEIIFNKETKLPYTDTYSDSICYTDIKRVDVPVIDFPFLEIHFEDGTEIYFNMEGISSVQINDMDSIDESILSDIEDIEDEETPDKGDLN